MKMQSSEPKPSKLATVLLAGVASLGLAVSASAAGVGANVDAGAKITPPAGVMAQSRAGMSGELSGDARTRASTQADEMRTQAEDARTRAESQAEEMRTQAEETRTRAQSQAEETRSQVQQMTPDVRGEAGVSVGGSAGTRR